MADRFEERPAFYALRGGGWRDWWTLLHPPYTLWHLSYVALGAAVAPELHIDRLVKALVAFFLAVGVGAHALDELNGRPLRTRIPATLLALLAAVSIGGAVAIGIANISLVGAPAVPFILFGVFIVVVYNLELFGGRFHSDLWFATAWGAFPALTGSWSQGEFRPEALPVVAACFALSLAQRALSTPVRDLRRRTTRVEGLIERSDGSVEPIDRSVLTGPPERALRALSAALPLLACGAVLARLVG